MKKLRSSLMGKMFIALLIVLAAVSGRAGNLTIDTVPGWQIGTGNTEYVCIGKGDTVKFTVNSTVGDSGPIGNYVWDVGAATVVTGGNGSNTVTLLFGNATNGASNGVSVGFTHTDPNNGIVCTSNTSMLDTVTVEVIALDVMNVSYSDSGDGGNVRMIDTGSNSTTMYGNTTGVSITSPEWISGGNVNPVCYVQGSNPMLTVQFSISPNLSIANVTANATITGLMQTLRTGNSNIGNIGLYCNGNMAVSLTGNNTTINFSTGNAIPGYVCQGTFNGTYTYLINGGATNNMVTNPQNSFDFVYGKPDTSNVTVTKCRLDFWCGAFNGTTNSTGIINMVGLLATSHGNFNHTSNFVANATTLETLPNAYDLAWQVFNTNSGGILLGGDCDTLSYFMASSLMLLGISPGDGVVYVYACHVDWSHIENTSRTANEIGGGSLGRLGYIDGGWNNFQGCLKIQGVYWLGGFGITEPTNKGVLACVCTNNPGDSTFQCYITAQSTRVTNPDQ
jgi:hypothetical protein